MIMHNNKILEFEVEALRLRLQRAYEKRDHETVKLISAIFDGITLERISATQSGGSQREQAELDERQS